MNELELLDRVGWEGIQRIKLLRRNIKRMLKTKGICKMISVAINREMRLPIVIGQHSNREHWWNVFNDGAILDASADQFGYAPIIVILPTDSEYAAYEQNK